MLASHPMRAPSLHIAPGTQCLIVASSALGSEAVGSSFSEVNCSCGQHSDHLT
jgi:hypothetical protein